MKYYLNIEELFCAAVSKLRDLDWIIIGPIKPTVDSPFNYYYNTLFKCS